MKVAFLTPVYGYGGVERWIQAVARSIKHESIVVVLNQIPSSDKTIDNLNQHIPVFVINPTDTVNFLTQHQIDIVITWGLMDISRLLTGFPNTVIVASHGSDVLWTKDCVLAASGIASHFVGVSKSALNAIIAAGYKPENMSVIPNGIEIDRLKPIQGRQAYRKSFGISDDDFIIGYVGRYSPEKRINVLIEAIKLLPEKYKAFLCGCGAEKDYLENIASSVKNRVFFIDYDLSIGDKLASFDLYWGGSLDEGFWLAGIEAAIAGVPLLTNTVGILCEIKKNYGILWGELPNFCTPEQTRDGILNYKFDKKIIEKFQKILEQYSLERQGESWNNLLNKIQNKPVYTSQKKSQVPPALHPDCYLKKNPNKPKEADEQEEKRDVVVEIKTITIKC